MRPGIAFLCCAAAGGDPRTALRWPRRSSSYTISRSYTTIFRMKARVVAVQPLWKLWGIGQAINAGDALFAAAQLALLRLNLSPELNLRLVESFNRMTIEIVAGQVLDLGFEGRDDVADDYLRMIAGKTSAIVRYAAWAGALVGGAEDETAGQFAEFGPGARSRIPDSRRCARHLGSVIGNGKGGGGRHPAKTSPTILLLRSRSTKTNGPNSATL